MRAQKRLIRIRDGIKLINLVFDEYRRRLYEYNDRIKEFNYYLKPVHEVTYYYKGIPRKYQYFGRYWYRLVKNPKSKGGLKWIYVGREKPDPHLPEPPLNPFEGIKVVVENNDLLIDENVYVLLKRVLKNNYGIDIDKYVYER